MQTLANDGVQPKVPTRERGIRRVEALLNAASAVFVAKGFDAATTAEIAERAGSSIGSLYQFFPTKESISDALRLRYGEALCAKWDAMARASEPSTAGGLAEALFKQIAETLVEHPAFPVLESVRHKALGNVSDVRERYMASLSNLIRSRAPGLGDNDLRIATLVVLQILRCEIAMEATPESGNRQTVLSELQRVLANYLSDKVG